MRVDKTNALDCALHGRIPIRQKVRMGMVGIDCRRHKDQQSARNDGFHDCSPGAGPTSAPIPSMSSFGVTEMLRAPSFRERRAALAHETIHSRAAPPTVEVAWPDAGRTPRSEEHTSELQSPYVCSE